MDSVYKARADRITPGGFPLLLLPVIFTLFFHGIILGQANYCDNSVPICLEEPFTYPADTTGTAEPGAFYACLATQIAPAWFHMRIADPGDITIYMFNDSLVDIDFICWGPFTDPYAPCVEGLAANKVIDCSYQPTPAEYCDIPDGQAGEYYILMITNYSQQPTEITITQSGGSGALECNLVSGPDLVVKYPDIYPETILAGDTLTVSSTVFNHGNQDAAVSKLFYYLSSDSIFTHNDLESGYDYNGTLDAGDSVNLNSTVIVPAGTFPGTWYILFFADADQQIEEYNEDNNLNFSSFTVDTVTGIDDHNRITEGSDIKIYPNPSHDRLYIEYPGLNDLSEIKIDIYSSPGTLIKTITKALIGRDLLSVSIQNLPAGIYLVRINMNGEIVCRKIQVI